MIANVWKHRKVTAGMALLTLAIAGCQQSGPFRFGSTKSTSHSQLSSVKRPGDKPGVAQQQVEMQLLIAHTKERQGKLDEARRGYLRAIEMDKDNADANHRLAVLHDKRGEFQQSAALYNKALQRKPKDAKLLCDLGYSYYLQQRWKESEIQLRKAVEISPSLQRARNNLGLALAHLGRREEALQEFAAAGCSHGEARVNLAIALLLSGEREQARQELQLALADDESLQPARKMLAELNGDTRPQQESPEKSSPAVAAEAGPPAEARLASVAGQRVEGTKGDAVKPAVRSTILSELTSDASVAKPTRQEADHRTLFRQATVVKPESATIQTEPMVEKPAATIARPVSFEVSQPPVVTAGIVKYADPPAAKDVQAKRDTAGASRDTAGASKEVVAVREIRRFPPVFGMNPLRLLR